MCIKSYDLFKIKEIEIAMVRCNFNAIDEEQIKTLVKYLEEKIDDPFFCFCKSFSYINCQRCIFSLHDNNNDDATKVEGAYLCSERDLNGDYSACIEGNYPLRIKSKEKLIHIIKEVGPKKFGELLLKMKEIYKKAGVIK